MPVETEAVNMQNDVWLWCANGVPMAEQVNQVHRVTFRGFIDPGLM
jgi:hypothetical protein